MKRYTGQKALYEAIARTRAKSQRRGILEWLHPGNAKGEDVEQSVVEAPKPQIQVEPIKPPVVEKPPAPAIKPIRPAEVQRPEPQPRSAQPWLCPKAVQLHDGRIEISLPYTLGITVVLVGILLVLGAFRLGQMQRRAQLPAVKNSTFDQTKQPAPKASPSPVKQEVPAPVKETASTDTGGSATAPVQEGDHVIVLAQHAQRAPLESAREYFKEHGVATEVIGVAALRDYLAGQGINTSVLGTRGGFMLVTADYYDNPQNPGTNGFQAKQKIIELGRGYKATAGSESFAPNYFSDAYGMKVR